jgi:rare lipoprotein A
MPFMAPRIFCACIVVTVLVGSACGRRQAVSRPPAAGRLPASTAGNGAPETVRPGYTEEGYASWYGDPYHGRRAANGEIYDKNKLTAAHLTLPFGTRTKVTNLETNRSVEVRITDRGPFVKGRIIDLSQEAARQVRMIGTGTALVRLEVLAVSGAPAAGSYAVQVGAFRERSTAERLQQSLRSRYGGAFVEPYESSEGRFYRVRVGPKPSVLEARRLAAQLGNENLPTFVVRLNN